jgi:hypothetical protein
MHFGNTSISGTLIASTGMVGLRSVQTSTRCDGYTYVDFGNSATLTTTITFVAWGAGSFEFGFAGHNVAIGSGACNVRFNVILSNITANVSTLGGAYYSGFVTGLSIAGNSSGVVTITISRASGTYGAYGTVYIKGFTGNGTFTLSRTLSF